MTHNFCAFAYKTFRIQPQRISHGLSGLRNFIPIVGVQSDIERNGPEAHYALDQFRAPRKNALDQFSYKSAVIELLYIFLALLRCLEKRSAGKLGAGKERSAGK